MTNWLVGFAGWIAFVLFMGFLVEQSHAQTPQQLIDEALAAAEAAQAAMQCGKRATFAAQLAQKYKEAPVAIGLSKQGSLWELFATVDGATWTLVLNNPNGKTCLIDSGEGWTVLAPPPGPET